MTGTITRRFARTAGALAVLALSIAGAACIQKEIRSVMYLDASGSVSWSITESDARSDAETPAERAEEEARFRDDMLANPARLVTLFESLGGYSITRTVLKDRAPFEAHTAAQFDRIDVLFERICATAGLLCASSVASEGDRTTLTVEVVGEIDSSEDKPDSMDDALTNLTIVCVEGRFVQASGFTLDGDRKAKIADFDGPDDHLVLTLTWQR